MSQLLKQKDLLSLDNYRYPVNLARFVDDFRGKDESQLKLEHLQTHARFPEIEAHLETLKRFTRVALARLQH